MGVTKAALIAVGTVGGMGAVLAYSPPHHSLSMGGAFTGSATGATLPTTAPTKVDAPTPTPTSVTTTEPSSATPAATKSATTTPTPTPTHSAPAAKATKAAPKPAPTKKKAPPKKTLVNGTFDGATSKTVYGPVQVQIVIKDSKIVQVSALQLPNAQPYDIQLDQQAVPVLVSQTLAAQSADIQGVAGASYTSQGWYDSLVSALAKSGI